MTAVRWLSCLTALVAIWMCMWQPAWSAGASGGAVVELRARAIYVPSGYTQQEIVTSNAVAVVVASIEALDLTQDQTIVRPAGSPIRFAHLLSNLGNVTSSYTFALANDGSGCSPDNANLNSLRAARDVNANGLIDNGDPMLALGTPAALTLPAGDIATLLIEGMVASNVSAGTACVSLTVTADATSTSKTNVDVVNIGNTAAVVVTKSASYPGIIQPGTTTIDFTITASNVGGEDAQPIAADPLGTSVLVDGTPHTLVLLRDEIPAGTRYVMGSLQTHMGGALRLFRMNGDAPLSYRTAGDDSAAVEVAIGLPTSVVRNGAASMSFAVRVGTNSSGMVLNTARVNFGNSSGASIEEQSNTIVIPVMTARIGVAKAADQPVAGIDPQGNKDSTVTVRFSVLARNYGTSSLSDVQVTDVLEGSGTAFGTYSSAAVPGVGEYTIVPGSLRIAQLTGTGSTASIRPDFTGQASHALLLADGAQLPPRGAVLIEFDVRLNVIGRPVVLYNSANAEAAILPNGARDIRDRSVDGQDPDPDGDGIPTNNTSPTPVSMALPALTLTKTVTLPRRTQTPGVYEFDYSLTVANTGTVPAPNVRLIDNLDCTFRMDQADTPIESWQLLGTPRAANGLLQISPAFTGQAACNRAAIENADPSASVPTDIALALTDGAVELRAGHSETVTFTVRAALKPEAIGTRVRIANKAWAVSYDRNLSDPANAMALATASTTTDVLLTDPQGIVYNAVTRQAVGGATVTLRRESCSSSPVTPIAPAEIFYGDNDGLYTFHADGAVSMTSPASGEYQFFFKSPPVNDLCTYRLTVEPPADSGLVAPSALVAAQTGTFTACGNVVPNASHPTGADLTTWYSLVRAGPTSGGGVCEVFHNHIPLDPQSLNGLVLKKEGSKAEAELGDFVDYTLALSNSSGIALTQLSVADRLPPGFAYVPGTTRIDGEAAPDPAGGRGPDLTFDLSTHTLGAGERLEVSYRLRIGVGAPSNGDAVNRAQATSGQGSTRLFSNEASWRVRVSGGVFSDEAFVFGKVFLDCDRDGVQGYEEVGVPGVRIFMEDGTSVVTDVEGKWSLYGLRPVTHVVKLDTLTLPRGARIGRIDNRQGGASSTRFVDLKKGEWHKANFAIDNCDDEATVAEVHERRKALALRPDSEGEAARLRQRLDPEGKNVVVGDPRALPASGQLGPDGSVQAPPPTDGALIDLPGGTTMIPRTQPADPLMPLAMPSQPQPVSSSPSQAPAVVPLEELLPQLDNSLGFIGLQHGQVVSRGTINVRVKGELGMVLKLYVNGEPVSERRVGKKTALQDKRLLAWEYIGVQLRPGENKVEVESLNEFGLHVALHGITVVAPDKLGSIELQMPTIARADATVPVPVRVRLLDVNGVLVTARNVLTLESTLGRWESADTQPGEPGTQVFIEGGTAELALIPPTEPGDGRVRLSVGQVEEDAQIVFLPDLRPLTGAGIVEGVVNLSKRGTIALGAPRARDAFEEELRGFSRESDDVHGAGRAAFYFKGTIKGEYLLTAAYDSDKDERERLFRDIRPDEFYPVYGDSAVRTFDAQSTQRFYVRIDKNRSWLMYGDFTSASSPEVRQLSQTNRSLTGAQHQFENEWVRIKSYASRDSLKQRIEEFPANGTSGPYPLSGAGDLLANSERVEVVVRDRDQPNVVLSTRQLSRFVDYSIEPLSRRLLLTSPLASFDRDFNPQSIRITYEVDTGGPQFWVGGIDAQAKLGERVQLGLAAATDEDPDNNRQLGAVTALAQLGENTVFAAEAVATRSDLQEEEGKAGRVELRHDGESLTAHIQAGKTDAAFDNPGATLSKGRTEASARAEYKLSGTTRLRGELIHSEDDVGASERRGAALSVQQKLGAYFTGELGTRVGERTGLQNGGFDYGTVSSPSGSTTAPAPVSSETDDLVTVRGRLTATLPESRAEVFLEAEQAVEEHERRVLAAGGHYQLMKKLRAYGRYELISTLYGGPYDLQSGVQNNVGVFGLESDYMTGGQIFSEYRLRDTIDARGGQAAYGLRNTFNVGEGLRLNGALEYTGAAPTIDGSPGGASTAVSTGFEYASMGDWAGRLRASGALELRSADTGDSVLNTLGLALKLDRDWSLLARSIVSDTQGSAGAGDRLLARQQIGIAYRPVDQDIWNSLARYEHKLEESSGNFEYEARAHILSAHLNVQPNAALSINGRYAAKWSLLTDDALESSYWAQLVFARLTYDIAQNWDAGIQAGVLFGEGGAQQRTLGVEAGYNLAQNLWLSLGYNVLGLSDPDLAGADYTERGLYLRVRMKFDESLFTSGATGVRP